MPPRVELSGADPMLARHLGRRQISAIALRYNLALLLHRPSPTTLASGDELQSRQTSALTTSRMSALIVSHDIGDGVTGSAKLTQGGKMNLTHPANWFLRCGEL